MGETATAYQTTHTAAGRGEETFTATYCLRADLVTLVDATADGASTEALPVTASDVVALALCEFFLARWGLGPDNAARLTAWGRAREVACG